MAVHTSTLLPPALVMLVPLDELTCRTQEINATHPHFQEETPLVLAREPSAANNKHLVDELIDTSLYRGGAPVARRPGYFADGDTFTTPSGSPIPATTTSAGSQELVQAVERVEDAVKSLPSRVHAFVEWTQADTLALEDQLSDLTDEGNRGQIK